MTKRTKRLVLGWAMILVPVTAFCGWATTLIVSVLGWGHFLMLMGAVGGALFIGGLIGTGVILVMNGGGKDEKVDR